MIFAKIIYDGTYESRHGEMVEFISSRFSNVEHGFQCDSWIWIHFGEDKVAVDTFSSDKHWIKSSRAGNHVDCVLKALSERFEISVLNIPEMEPHE